MKEVPYEPSSGLGWVHFSEKDRGKVMQVLDLLGQPNTVDELGVGVVRDALADTLFPGITTIMTRAKYFILVPRIMNDIWRKPAKGRSTEQELRAQENEVMRLLAEAHGYGENLGIMGITYAKQNRSLPQSRYRELARKPSTIYWNGLRTYGIYTGRLSMADLLRNWDQRKPVLHGGYAADEEEAGDDQDVLFEDGRIPFRSPGGKQHWKGELSIELTESEAAFLRDRIIATQGTSFLGLLLKDLSLATQFCEAEDFEEMSIMHFVNTLPEDVRLTIRTARDFWTIMLGAHIRFNVLLQRKAGSKEEETRMLEQWQDWVGKMASFPWDRFNRDRLWAIAEHRTPVKAPTRHFIETWMDLAMARPMDTDRMDELVGKRERLNKGARSKLGASAEEGAHYREWVGIGAMNYRFAQVKTLLKDILHAMPHA
jgi:hypothetical protein